MGTAHVLRWEELTGSDFDRIDPERTVVVVTCSPLEVHGPHLPVKADFCEAEGLMTETMELLATTHAELLFLRLPTLYVATDVVPRRGSVMFSSDTVIDTLSDLGRSLCKQGFRHIWVSNFHGSPRHFLSIEMACDRVNSQHGGRMISVFSGLVRRLTQGTSDAADVLSGIRGLDASRLAGDTHGGAIETSLMLHLDPDHVDPNYIHLDRNTIDLWRARIGKPSADPGSKRLSLFARARALIAALEYFQSQTYAGDPAIATPEMGQEILSCFSRHAAEALSEYWQGKLTTKDFHSPLWPLRHLVLSRGVGQVIDRLIGATGAVF
jgi:creatinine amidohydrolase